MMNRAGLDYDRIVATVIEDMKRDLTVGNKKTWTRVAFVGQTTLVRAFNTVVGMPPASYRCKLRMEEAKRLLRETDYKVGQIATMVGYTNGRGFVTWFKHLYGLTPSEYRKLART